jgi:hypothetical protein
LQCSCIDVSNHAVGFWIPSGGNTYQGIAQGLGAHIQLIAEDQLLEELFALWGASDPFGLLRAEIGIIDNFGIVKCLLDQNSAAIRVLSGTNPEAVG